MASSSIPNIHQATKAMQLAVFFVEQSHNCKIPGHKQGVISYFNHTHDTFGTPDYFERQIDFLSGIPKEDWADCLDCKSSAADAWRSAVGMIILEQLIREAPCNCDKCKTK